MVSNNDYIKDEYNYIREAIAKTMNTINEIKNLPQVNIRFLRKLPLGP